MDLLLPTLYFPTQNDGINVLLNLWSKSKFSIMTSIYSLELLNFFPFSLLKERKQGYYLLNGCMHIATYESINK